MKTKFKGLFKKSLIMTLVLTLLLSVSNTSFAAQETWNKGEKLSYIPKTSATTYKASDWTKSLVSLYKLTWYETPSRQVLKGEFMLVQLRTIQASLERRNLTVLSASDEKFDFKDKNTLIASAQEEAKILKSLGILTGTSDGYMKIANSIKRSEAAKVISVTNSKILKIPAVKIAKKFTDTKGNWAENSISIAYQIGLMSGVSNTTFEPDKSLTLEQTLQILENEIGYYGITRVDVAKAMNETFKVTLNTDVSNSTISQGSYAKYEEKMKVYGFSTLYNNKSAKTSETVTKAEALKMAIAIVFNTNDISGFALENDEYDNAIWVDFAKAKEITKEDINISNYMNKATYIDVISYFEIAKVKFLKKQAIKDTDIYLTDMSKYSDEEQSAVKDMVANEIIYPLADKLNGSNNIFKGQLNEIVVNFIEKYNTTLKNGDKININPEKMPSNSDQYSFILSNINKSIYEMPFQVEYKKDFLNPKELYTYKRMYYPQMIDSSESFFNVLLNVNYNTITENGLKEKLSEFFVFEPNDYAIKKYVENVKKNKIIIEGKAKMLVPMVYCDGLSYRARMQITFEVKNSTTKDNLIYLDYIGGLKKTYSKVKYEFIADYYMANAIGTQNVYMQQEDLYRTIINKEKSGITQEILK
jgi:hypothetical protein